MTSIKQIEANRRNAGKSTGPATEAGKQRSRCNAVRHGLTAETVIGALEDAEDYKAFEAAVTADYDAQSAVERELVLRLASLLWRLRRATTMETGLFDIQAEHLRAFERDRQVKPDQRRIVYSISGQTYSRDNGDHRQTADRDSASGESAGTDLARCFLRLANLPTYPLDRLSRYEATLWRQAGQTVFALEALRRRTSQHNDRRFSFGARQQVLTDEDAEL